MARTSPQADLHFVDLFAGCGGLSLGLEQAKFKPVFVNELNEQALATYRVNRPEFQWLADDLHSISDVREMTSRRYLEELAARLEKEFGAGQGQLDLVAGGPPCQGFSGIGHRRSYSVAKMEIPSNHLFLEMKKVIQGLRPKAFLFENVRGLLNARWTEDGGHQQIWKAVYNAFSTIKGYQVRWSLVFAKDYGVPQNRPRVLVVGLREDVLTAAINIHRRNEDRCPKIDLAEGHDAVKSGFLPPPNRRNPPDLDALLGDLVDPRYDTEPRPNKTATYPREPQNDIQRMFRRGRDSTATYFTTQDRVSDHEYSRHSPETIRKFKWMIKHPGVGPKSPSFPEDFRTKKFAQRVLPRVWTAKGPTITATSLPDDYIHWVQPRSLTVREWARLQTFPDWYTFQGKRTTGGLRRAGNPRKGIFEREVPKYTQIGNAVPVLLAKAVGEHLAKILRPQA